MIKRNYFFLGLILTATLGGMLLMYQLVYSPVLPGSEQSKIIRIPAGTDFKGLLKLLEDEKILTNVRDMYTTESGGIIPTESAKHHENCSEKLYSDLRNVY
jgi:cell division protein YceG involved in septum cleavage